MQLRMRSFASLQLLTLNPLVMAFLNQLECEFARTQWIGQRFSPNLRTKSGDSLPVRYLDRVNSHVVFCREQMPSLL